MRLERGWTSGDETAVEVRAGAAAAPGLGRRAVLAGGAGLALFGAGNDVGAAPPELLPDRLPGRVELGGAGLTVSRAAGTTGFRMSPSR